MKNTTKRFTTLAATALIAISTLGAAAVTASAKGVDATKAPVQYGVVQQVKTGQVKTTKAFKYYAYGKTSYGYDYTYKATNNNLIVKVNYNFKAHKYEFNVIGKKAGTVKLTLIWNVNDKKTDSATFNLRVDKNGNVTNIDDVHAPSMRG